MTSTKKQQRCMVELTKLETLTVSGGGECYWALNSTDITTPDIQKIERGDLGDIGPTVCGNNCCEILGKSANWTCVGWIYNGTNYETPIVILSTGEILQDTQEVRGSC